MDFSRVKQELQTRFDAIQAHANEGDLPSASDAQALFRMATQMHKLAPDEWADEAADFLQLVEELHACVKKGLLQDAILIVDSLDDARTFCHRTFR